MQFMLELDIMQKTPCWSFPMPRKSGHTFGSSVRSTSTSHYIANEVQGSERSIIIADMSHLRVSLTHWGSSMTYWSSSRRPVQTSEPLGYDRFSAYDFSTVAKLWTQGVESTAKWRTSKQWRSQSPTTIHGGRSYTSTLEAGYLQRLMRTELGHEIAATQFGIATSGARGSRDLGVQFRPRLCFESHRRRWVYFGSQISTATANWWWMLHYLCRISDLMGEPIKKKHCCGCMQSSTILKINVTAILTLRCHGDTKVVSL